MLRPGSFALTLLLSFLTALGPLSMDMYLPSLPDIGRQLHALTLQVQLSISSYLFGFAVGQIFYGPVSDRFGRRPILLAAIVLYGLASIGCAAAQSIAGKPALASLKIRFKSVPASTIASTPSRRHSVAAISRRRPSSPGEHRPFCARSR